MSPKSGGIYRRSQEKGDGEREEEDKDPAAGGRRTATFSLTPSLPLMLAPPRAPAIYHHTGARAHDPFSMCVQTGGGAQIGGSLTCANSRACIDEAAREGCVCERCTHLRGARARLCACEVHAWLRACSCVREVHACEDARVRARGSALYTHLSCVRCVRVLYAHMKSYFL